MRYKHWGNLFVVAFALTACNVIPQRQQAISTVTDTANPSITEASLQTVKSVQAYPEEIQEPSLPTEAVAANNYNDVWLRIADHLQFDRHINYRSVKDKLSWYKRNQDYLDRVAARAQPFIYYILGELEKRNMPLDLALLPIVESAYHPFAYSPSHASGIWQFIPSTGKHYGLKQNWWYDGRRDIIESTRAALDYLQKLHQEFNGDWLLALAAYNTGERNVARAIAKNKRNGKQVDFWSLRLPRETRGYVPSLLAVAELVARPAKYQISWSPIESSPYFVDIDTGGQLDLAIAAQLADITIDDFYTLNPAFNRWATDPEGPHSLLVPVNKKDLFINNLAHLPVNERISWKRHVISRGETLSQIAERYHTSINILKQTNGLRSNLIRTGHSLLIPTAKQSMSYYSLSLDARRFRDLKRSGSGQQYVYTVRRGDTLWDIGNQYGVNVKTLCAWNGINSRSILRPGQKLNLWFSEKGQVLAGISETTKAALKMPSTIPGSAQTIKYTVKKGDSLWLISKRFGTTVAQLRKWNNLPARGFIKPGQKLVLYIQEV